MIKKNPQWCPIFLHKFSTTIQQRYVAVEYFIMTYVTAAGASAILYLPYQQLIFGIVLYALDM